jgi:hypothetical protein
LRNLRRRHRHLLPAAIRASDFTEQLVEIPLVGPIVHRTKCLVRRRNETVTPAAAALYAVLDAELSRYTE